MTPPVGSTPGATGLPVASSVGESGGNESGSTTSSLNGAGRHGLASEASNSAAPYRFRPQPLLNLQPEFANPVRSTRTIRTFGDIDSAIVEDFIRGRLGSSVKLMQRLGSFEWLNPNRAITEPLFDNATGKASMSYWSPDRKPDFNIVGDGEAICRRLAPLFGWDGPTLEANIARVRGGMIYQNFAMETPMGPIPLKMGILDQNVLFAERGLLSSEPYFSLRASLLPSEGTYMFLDGDEGFRDRFWNWERANKGDYLRRSLGTFLFRSHLNTEDIVNRSFTLQFRRYESYRVFDWFKGPKQATRLQSVHPEIFVPAIQQYLRENRDLKVYHLGSELRPDDVSVTNFRDLQFVLDRGIFARIGAFVRSQFEFAVLNIRNGRQTFRNIGSNGTRRHGYHDPNWLEYFGRKMSRLVGLNGEFETREYTPESSHFPTAEAREGRTETPLRQMVLLAGYDKGGEEVPEVFNEILRYSRSEVAKGANLNPLFRGIEPSKFTIPVRGVPSAAYQMMNWLMSDGMEHLTVVGTPDTKVVFDRFMSFYSEDIAARGKTAHFELQGRNFTDGLRKGLATVPYKGEAVATSFGDNPLIDMDRMAHHPLRFLVDWIVAPNSRSRLSHDGGKNYHADGITEGVHDPAKEGNAYTYPSDLDRVPWDVLQAIFDSRKSMADSGTKSKSRIIADILLLDPIRNTLTFQWLRRRAPGEPPPAGISNVLLDGLPGIVRLGAGFAKYQFMKRIMGRRIPETSLPMELSEHLLDKLLNVRSSLAPNHSDPGGVLDLDGVFDLTIAKRLMEETDRPESIYKHWEKLAPFADAIQADAEALPALRGTPARINDLYRRLRLALMEPPPPGQKGRAYSSEELRRRGLAADVPPMLEDGRMNPQFLELVLPERDFQFYRLGFEAYNRRAEHAKGLHADFTARIHGTVAPEASDLLDTRIQRVIERTLSADPERSRAMLIEWNFDRISNSLRDAVTKQFGVDSREAADLERYIERSTTGNVDTPLRRVYMGMKAVDVLRRSMNHLAPEEYRELFPNLQETLHQAVEASDSRGLRDFFKFAGTTADREFVRRVGESPPAFRNPSGIKGAVHPAHSNNRAGFERRPGTTNGHSEIYRVESAAFMPQDIEMLARTLKIMPSRIPHLIAAAAGADSNARLTRIVEERLTPERLLAWAQTEEGSRYLSDRSSVFEDTFRNRLREAGPGLVVGIASLLGAEKLADLAGLDARNHPQERFMFVVALGHISNGVTSSVNEVLINRSLGQPFSFVTSRSVSAGGEAALQYTFEARTSFGRSVLDSLTRNFALRGGLGRIAWNGVRGTVTLPFRAAWGMGPGLMSSALVDRTIGRMFDEGSRPRELLKFGSFFLPDLYRIGVGNRGFYLFENPLMRGASRAFAAGFIADMLFLTANRVTYGSEGSATQLGIYQRANILHDRNRSWYTRPIDGAFEMVAPSLSAWWDSVEFDGLNLVPNRYQREARAELGRFSSSTTDQARDLFRHALLNGIGGSDLNPEFYTTVGFDFVRGPNSLSGHTTADGRSLPVEQILEQISDPAVNARFMAMNSADQITYIRNQFRGYRLSHEDATACLDLISLNRLRGDIAQFGNFAISENASLRDLFDGTGSLRAGRDDELRRFAVGETSTSEILETRRLGLAVRILRLREEGSSDLARYESVARRAGILNESGGFVRSDLEAAARSQLAIAAGTDPNASPATTYAASAARMSRASLPRLGSSLWRRAG